MVRTIVDTFELPIVVGIRTSDGSGNMNDTGGLRPEHSDKWDELTGLYNEYRIKSIELIAIPVTSNSSGGLYVLSGEFSDEATPTLSYTSITDAIENAVNQKISAVGKVPFASLKATNPNKDWMQLDTDELDEGQFPQSFAWNMYGAYLPASSNIAYLICKYTVDVRRSFS